MPDEREENFPPLTDCGSEVGVPHTSEFPYWISDFRNPVFMQLCSDLTAYLQSC